MPTLLELGRAISERRRELQLNRLALAKQAGISLATLESLENGRSRELGFSKIMKILSALKLDLRIQEANAQRPTLDELIREDSDDQSLGRRSWRRSA
jgi:transcriptional regulator with XRE-family HTH domain